MLGIGDTVGNKTESSLSPKNLHSSEGDIYIQLFNYNYGKHTSAILFKHVVIHSLVRRKKSGH